ncbi:MAG TPA: UbiA family prenyltransferase [Verrucomicrobiae bacterium]|nr:UbiA family prenyltransferase [Verrucomicrobiae bacterium]
MTQVLSSAPSLASNLARLGRPQNIVYSGLLAIEATSLYHQWVIGIEYYVLLFCLYNVAAGYNNIRDLDIDLHNNADRNPLITGALSMRVVYSWLALNILAIIGLQFYLPQSSSLLYSVMYIFLLYAYSSRQLNVQAKGFLATIVLATCYGAIPLMLAGTPHLHNIGWLAGLQILLLSPYLLAKDYKDLSGDKRGNKQTPLVRYGARAIQRVAAITYLAGCVGILYVLVGTHRHLTVVTVTCLLLAAGACVTEVHRKQGLVPQYFIRLTQGLLLALNYLLLANFG